MVTESYAKNLKNKENEKKKSRKVERVIEGNEGLIPHSVNVIHNHPPKYKLVSKRQHSQHISSSMTHTNFSHFWLPHTLHVEGVRPHTPLSLSCKRNAGVSERKEILF